MCQIKWKNLLVGGNICSPPLGSVLSSVSAPGSLCRPTCSPEKSRRTCSLSVQSSPVFLRLSPRSVVLTSVHNHFQFFCPSRVCFQDRSRAPHLSQLFTAIPFCIPFSLCLSVIPFSLHLGYLIFSTAFLLPVFFPGSISHTIP